jgi:hypothetical protein
VGWDSGQAFDGDCPVTDVTHLLNSLDGGDPFTAALFGGGVRSVAFTPDGCYLVTANANGMVYVLRATISGN